MGHEKVADREPVLRAMFGPDYKEATKDAAYQQELYDKDAQDKGELVVIGTKLAYDSLELRRLAVQKNLFGRHGRVRGVACLMLWNQCENWEVMLEKLVLPEIRELVAAKDQETLRETLDRWVPPDVVALFADLSDEEDVTRMRLLHGPQRARVFEYLDRVSQRKLLANFSEDVARHAAVSE